MKIEVIFRTVLVLQLTLLMSVVVVDSYFIEHLPDILQEYWLIEEQREIATSEAILFLFVYPLLLLYLASIVGLFFLKTWAKYFYIGTTVVLFFLVPFFGPTVEHAFATTLSSLESTSIGFIIAMLLLTDVVPAKKYA